MKAHHSLADGISVMCLNLFMSAQYDRSYFVKTSDASLLIQIYVRLASLFYMPYTTLKSLGIRADKNFITKDKRKKLTGEMNCQSTGEMKLPEIKELTKKLGVTINDLVTSSISTAFQQIFAERGEKHLK